MPNVWLQSTNAAVFLPISEFDLSEGVVETIEEKKPLGTCGACLTQQLDGLQRLDKDEGHVQTA